MASQYCSLGFVSVVMIIILALELSSAECDQGTESQKDDVLLQSDTKFLLGRKMLQELNGKPVYTTGGSKHNSVTQVQRQSNHVQSQQQHPQKAILNVVKHNESTSTKHEESKEAFLEAAADEVANLMRKDYRGMARRKAPPINNHEHKD